MPRILTFAESMSSDSETLSISDDAQSEFDEIDSKTRHDICVKFEKMFYDIFVVDKKREWPDRFLFKDFTMRNRVTLTCVIPTFVDKEFGDDFLLQVLPVLSASLRVVYQLKENDHKNGKRQKHSKLDRGTVLHVLNTIVREYVVDIQDGVPIMDDIVAKAKNTSWMG